jgi:hypothetical protein
MRQPAAAPARHSKAAGSMRQLIALVIAVCAYNQVAAELSGGAPPALAAREHGSRA